MRDDPREEIVHVEPIVQAHIFAQNECILPELRATVKKQTATLTRV